MGKMHGAVFHWLSRKRAFIRIPEDRRMAGMPVMSVMLDCELEYGMPEVAAEVGPRPLDALDELGPFDRGLLEGWLDGWTDREMGQRMGLSGPAVWSKRHTAFDRLRRRMGG